MNNSKHGNKERVLIIGIDGGTFEAISPLVDRGELPAIASLMQNGMWGDLESTIPPDTGPAWVSMMTGVNPGKHGVFFFLDGLHDNLRYGKTLGSADIKFPPLWSVLSERGKKVLFMNVPFTYPPTNVNGVMVSGMLIPDSAQVVSYPDELHPELAALLNGFPINDWSPDIICSDKSKFHLHFDKTVKVLASVTEKRKKATLHLLQKDAWDFGMVVFTAIDRLQHLFWEYSGQKDASGLETVIEDGYRQIDRAIGEIVEAAGRDTTVIIASDHGFGPLEKYFFVNKWLEEIGLLSIKKNLSKKKMSFNVTSLRRVIEKILPTVKAPDWAERIQLPRLRLVKRSTNELIDWKRTKAYGDHSGGININLMGREPEGIVQPGQEYERILKNIRDRFSEIQDESNSRCLADWILRKEEIYNGPFMPEAADLYYSLNERSYLHNTDVDGKARVGNCSLGTGMHRKNGICIISGSHCKKAFKIQPRIIDIAPTALYLMGLPVFDEMDGRVLEEGILQDRLASHSIARVSVGTAGEKTTSYSNEDEGKIRDSLRGLGYL